MQFASPPNFKLPPLPSDGSKPSWEPFFMLPREERPAPPRPIETKDGIGDRLRAAAFAEIQAYYAFLWAADAFSDAPESLRTAWRGLALAEEKHLGWLLQRLEEIGIGVRERGVSDWLWQSLIACKSAREFAVFMASAEERGRRAGARFEQAMIKVDPHSAKIFGQIAREEVEHIQLALTYFPEETRAQVEKNGLVYS